MLGTCSLAEGGGGRREIGGRVDLGGFELGGWDGDGEVRGNEERRAAGWRAGLRAWGRAGAKRQLELYLTYFLSLRSHRKHYTGKR